MERHLTSHLSSPSAEGAEEGMVGGVQVQTFAAPRAGSSQSSTAVVRERHGMGNVEETLGQNQGTHNEVFSHDSPENCEHFPDRQSASPASGRTAPPGGTSGGVIGQGVVLSVIPNPAASYRSRQGLADWRPWDGVVSKEHLPTVLRGSVNLVQQVVRRLQRCEKSVMVVITHSFPASRLREHLGDSCVRNAQDRLTKLAVNSLEEVEDELLSADGAAIVDVISGRVIVERVSAPLQGVEEGPWKVQGGTRNQKAFALVWRLPEEVVVVVRKFKPQKDGTVLRWVSFYTPVYATANPPSFLCAVDDGCVRHRISQDDSDPPEGSESQHPGEDQCSSSEALQMVSTALSMYKYSEANVFTSFIEGIRSLPLENAVTQKDREVLRTWKELKKLCKRLEGQITDLHGKTALLGDSDQNRRIEHLLMFSRWQLAEEHLRKRIKTFRLQEAHPPPQYDFDKWMIEKLRCFHRMGISFLRQGKGKGKGKEEAAKESAEYWFHQTLRTGREFEGKRDCGASDTGSIPQSTLQPHIAGVQQQPQQPQQPQQQQQEKQEQPWGGIFGGQKQQPAVCVPGGAFGLFAPHALPPVQTQAPQRGMFCPPSFTPSITDSAVPHDRAPQFPTSSTGDIHSPSVGESLFTKSHPACRTPPEPGSTVPPSRRRGGTEGIRQSVKNASWEAVKHKRETMMEFEARMASASGALGRKEESSKHVKEENAWKVLDWLGFYGKDRRSSYEIDRKDSLSGNFEELGLILPEQKELDDTQHRSLESLDPHALPVSPSSPRAVGSKDWRQKLRKRLSRSTSAPAILGQPKDTEKEKLDKMLREFPVIFGPGIDLFRAAEAGDEAKVKALLAGGTPINWADEGGRTPLWVAAWHGHHNVVERLLRAGADKNKASNNGVTPLFIAAEKGHKDVVCTLLTEGADTDKADINQATPLFKAAEHGHQGIVKSLLEAGANKNKSMMNAVTPLSMAAQKGHRGVVCELLKAGADINHGEAPLIMAAQNGHLGIVRDLLKAGADANRVSKSNIGIWPLRQAAQNGHLDIVCALLEAGAEKDKTDMNGATPLYIAVRQGHPDVVSALLRAGADTNKGVTPLETACRKGDHEIAALLKAPSPSSSRSPHSQTTEEPRSGGSTSKDGQLPCANYGTVENLAVCTGCRKVNYCSRGCQKAHRKTHRADCK
uniref:MYND-type domain-containing protein n=1 Tax=Chromera velia CCMP2878 TaxID=1169474 RepID=A0A0G4GJB0_9ALVE|eukprot:Cvel_22152.t1-p1 / transcript=Cvel_22152.t1 / gene=Cvel_22152 / organism=Chromera_velia_CCMP2878 / gene_product=Ankyrin repeat domain-containing protein 50, putative / transcript_product=Ankyrin repeat domain-containing protein 50, putative / location=Cvel_scaffold2149:22694-31273(-) / protein_length=1174 / sequence_SO=supercontig / SO=protein_coding / is_pseudo=false